MTTEELSELLDCPRDDDGGHDDDGGEVFWRSPGGYWHPSGTTAWDMIVQMTKDGHNDDFLDAALASGLPLGEIPADECVWVTRSRADAEWYNRGDAEDHDAVNPEIYSFRVEGYEIIIPDDGDSGLLIWTPGIRSQT